MSLFGGITGAIGAGFGSDKVNQQYYSPGVNSNLNWLTGLFKGDNKSIDDALAAFTLENNTRTANNNRLRGLAEADYSNLFGQTQGYNPMGEYERLRSGNLGALKDWSGILGEQGRRTESLAQAALGLGGRPSGSYEKALVADRVSRNVAPVINTVMGNLGRDTSALGALRFNNIGQAANLIDSRTNTANIGYGDALAPAYAMMDFRNAQTGLLGGQAGVAKANSAGWQQDRNWADRLGDAGQAFDNTMNRDIGVAAGALGSLTGMGAMGGVGGMGGGGMSNMFSYPGTYTGSNMYGSYMMQPGGALRALRNPTQQALVNSYEQLYS
jgi:hypothetical protein